MSGLIQKGGGPTRAALREAVDKRNRKEKLLKCLENVVALIKIREEQVEKLKELRLAVLKELEVS